MLICGSDSNHKGIANNCLTYEAQCKECGEPMVQDASPVLPHGFEVVKTTTDFYICTCAECVKDELEYW